MGQRAKGRRRLSWGRAVAIVLGVALVLLGLSQLLPRLESEARYGRLSREMRPGLGEASAGSGAEAAGREVDWDGLRAQNPDVAAWVQVGNTPIDYPVVAPSDGDMGYYLRHDFWGRQSLAGCPFLDSRSAANGAHALAYGHHITGQDVMFSALRGCYQQEEFDGLGELVWSTPEEGSVALRPLCALRVDRRDEGIQAFEFADKGAFRVWLGLLVARSDARCDDAEGLVGSARRAVTLVTCASLESNRPWRTAVVFVDG